MLLSCELRLLSGLLLSRELSLLLSCKLSLLSGLLLSCELSLLSGLLLSCELRLLGGLLLGRELRGLLLGCELGGLLLSCELRLLRRMLLRDELSLLSGLLLSCELRLLSGLLNRGASVEAHGLPCARRPFADRRGHGWNRSGRCCRLKRGRGSDRLWRWDVGHQLRHGCCGGRSGSGLCGRSCSASAAWGRQATQLMGARKTARHLLHHGVHRFVADRQVLQHIQGFADVDDDRLAAGQILPFGSLDAMQDAHGLGDGLRELKQLHGRIGAGLKRV